MRQTWRLSEDLLLKVSKRIKPDFMFVNIKPLSHVEVSKYCHLDARLAY